MWPLQKDCDQFYGNPRGAVGRSNSAWEAANLAHVSPPFKMFYDGKPVQSVKIHRKCADSLSRVFAAIWIAAGRDQATIDRWGVSHFGGSYNFRLMRGSSHLSMHSYGCAIDLAPERFPMGRHDHTFVPQVIQAFANEGWENLPNDRMHFQAARVPGLVVPMPRATLPISKIQPLLENTPMDSTKPWYASQAIWGGIGAILGGLGAAYTALKSGNIADAVSNGQAAIVAIMGIISAFGGLQAIIGRVKATSTIGKAA